MSVVVFYEKPGCMGNHRQKALLSSMGIRLDVRNLLAAPWTAAALRAFFGNEPVRQWFNSSAPQVRSGGLAIDTCDEQEALELMLAEPLLIRRPLLQFREHRQSGFIAGPVFDALGVHIDDAGDLQSCPMSESDSRCGDAT